MKKRIGVLMLAMALVFSSCSRQQRTTTEEQTPNDIEYVNSLDELQENQYYICHEGKYLRPYIKYATFDTTTDTSNTTGSNRVAWFMDDWSKIPTMYPGDYIVFYSNSPLSETFHIERFEYLGYTVGIAGLKRTNSGRYSFNAVKSTEKNISLINPVSDAARLYKLNAESVIIDNIGTAELRSGNISRAGTINGLEANKTYQTDVYTGSKLNVYILKADSIALCSMEHHVIQDYDLLRNKVLRVNLPSELQDGYYAINGSGIFRYVNESSFSERTDFNIPNQLSDSKTTEDDTQHFQDSDDTIDRREINIEKTGTATITIKYSDDVSTGYRLSAPVAKLIGNATVYTLTNVDDGVLELKTKLQPGTYILETVGLYGRSFEVLPVRFEEE